MKAWVGRNDSSCVARPLDPREAAGAAKKERQRFWNGSRSELRSVNKVQREGQKSVVAQGLSFVDNSKRKKRWWVDFVGTEASAKTVRGQRGKKGGEVVDCQVVWFLTICILLLSRVPLPNRVIVAVLRRKDRLPFMPFTRTNCLSCPSHEQTAFCALLMKGSRPSPVVLCSICPDTAKSGGQGADFFRQLRDQDVKNGQAKQTD